MKTLRTVVPSNQSRCITVRSGQPCRTMRVYKITATEPIAVIPAPAAIHRSMSLVLFKAGRNARESKVGCSLADTRSQTDLGLNRHWGSDQ